MSRELEFDVIVEGYHCIGLSIWVLISEVICEVGANLVLIRAINYELLVSMLFFALNCAIGTYPKHLY